MPRVTRPQKGGGVQAVVFALDTLEYLAHSQTAVGVSELARAFETTKSRVHRHLQTLVKAGYLVREDQTERYRISTRLMALGQAIGDNFDLTRVARPILRRLRESLGHSVVVSKPEMDGVRILAVVPGKSQIELHGKPGSVLGFHNSAQGKIAVAFGERSLLDEVLRRGLPMSTPFTITDARKFAAEIDLVRKRGWALAPNESVIGMNALAAPVFDGLGKLAGAVAIVDSVQFIGEKPSAKQTREVLQAAQHISRDLGHRAG